MCNDQFSMYIFKLIDSHVITGSEYGLEDNLVTFSGKVIDVVGKLPKNLAAKHLGGQLVFILSKKCENSERKYEIIRNITLK